MYSIGCVDPVEFSKEKLLNTGAKSYKELLLILNEIVELILHKKNNLSNTNNEISISLTNNFNFEETLQKKIQILDNPIFFKEFHNLIQSASQSNIPSDLIKLIRSTNENSSYISMSTQAIKSMKKEEICNILKEKLTSVKEKIDKNQKNVRLI